MQYNRKLQISTAGTRKAMHWPKSEIMWSEFAEKLKTPVRGTETLEQYLVLPKSQQDELKDVGGFVGGTFEGDRRKAAGVVGRDLITLDLDNIPAGRRPRMRGRCLQHQKTFRICAETARDHPDRPDGICG